METIFDKTTRDRLISRIYTLDANSKAQWGKMNIHQMLKHCIKYEEMMLGQKRFKRTFLGRLFGKRALQGDFLKDESPIRLNTPTLKQLKIGKIENGDIASERNKWIGLIEEYEHFARSDVIIVHAFFGKLATEQVGYLDYKHTDHHLRQFNS